MIDRLRACIRTDLDCADICTATGRVLARHTGYDANLTRAVLEACRSCGEACAQHAERHDHCRICADACRACEQACADLLASLG